MPLTRDFRETVQDRAKIDPVFRKGLLTEGVDCLLAGEVEVGKILIRDYIDASGGFDELGALANKPPQSLMDMFGPAGNPPAGSLFEIIGQIQKREGIRLEVSALPYAEVADSEAYIAD